MPLTPDERALLAKLLADDEQPVETVAETVADAVAETAVAVADAVADAVVFHDPPPVVVEARTAEEIEAEQVAYAVGDAIRSDADAAAQVAVIDAEAAGAVAVIEAQAAAGGPPVVEAPVVDDVAPAADHEPTSGSRFVDRFFGGHR